MKKHPSPNNEFLNFDNPEPKFNWEFAIFWGLVICLFILALILIF